MDSEQSEPVATDSIEALAPSSGPTTWRDVIGQEKQKPYFRAILATIAEERARGIIIYPQDADIFTAFKLTPFDRVRVVIIGQDPYHGPGQAHGLSFSVPRGVPLPPSLQNIFEELKSDCQVPAPSHGCLESWASQGVLLLNATLTVRDGAPQSHQKLGWEQFTDKVISSLSEKRTGLVFLLWGASAQKKGAAIDTAKHSVLKAVHPLRSLLIEDSLAAGISPKLTLSSLFRAILPSIGRYRTNRHASWDLRRR